MAITYSGGLTITGGITQTVLGVGGSTSYNGTTQYLTVPSNAALQLATATPFAIEAWIYSTNLSATDHGIIGKRQAGNEWQLNINPSFGYLNFWNGATTYQSGITLAINTWYHVAVTWDATTLRFFVNGVMGSTYTGFTVSASTNQVIIGGTGPGASGLFAGYISNLRIVKGTAVYTAAFTPPTQPLTSLQSANVNGYPSAAITGTSTSLLLNMPNNSSYLNDSSTNGFTVTNVASVPSSSLTPFNPGSILFNGTSQYLSAPANTAYAFGTGDFTVESWIIQNDGSGNRPICQSDALGSSTNDKWWFAIAGGGLFFGTHNSGGFSVVTTTSFTLGTWYHVAVTRTGGIMRLFINGVSTAYTTTGTPRGYSLSQNGMTIGAMSTPSYWPGYLSNLRVVKGLSVYNNSGSILFSGTSQYLSIPLNAAFTYGTGDFTIESWFYLTAAGNVYPLIYSQPRAGNTTLDIRFGDDGFGNKLQVSLNSGTQASVWSCNITQAAAVGSWKHVALTRSGSTCRLFVNGVQQSLGSGANPGSFPVTSFTDSSNITTPTGCTIGSGFTGYITNSRVVKGVAVYTASFTPSTTPLTSTQSANVNGTPSAAITGTSTSLLLNMPNNSSYLTDSSSNGFTITTVGTPTSQSATPLVSNFTPPTTPFTSIQNANQNGNPSAAITGTSTSLLLNTQNGPAFIVDGSTNNATLTNTGSATTQSSIPFSL